MASRSEIRLSTRSGEIAIWFAAVAALAARPVVTVLFWPITNKLPRENLPITVGKELSAWSTARFS